jgi:hypothetical protein
MFGVGGDEGGGGGGGGVVRVISFRFCVRLLAGRSDRLGAHALILPPSVDQHIIGSRMSTCPLVQVQLVYEVFVSIILLNGEFLEAARAIAVK